MSSMTLPLSAAVFSHLCKSVCNPFLSFRLCSCALSLHCTQFTPVSTIRRVFRSSFLFALLPTSQMNFRLHFLLAGVCILIYVNETIASSSSKKRPPAMSGLQSGVWTVGTVWMLTDCLLNDIIGICGV